MKVIDLLKTELSGVLPKEEILEAYILHYCTTTL
jgi:hypothetical protein